MNTCHCNEPFITEGGAVFRGIDIAYHSWGSLNESCDNVIWVCHALTANSDVEAWWPGMVGDGLAFDTSKYFIVCANILGSCYGTTGPLSINPLTGNSWKNEFPVITIRDIVNLHEVLRRHLGINSVELIIGASIGGYQALEYSIMYPDIIKRLIFIAAGAKQTPWAIAFNESQRLAIEADPTFFNGDPAGGSKGLRAARSIALLSYRTSYAYNKTQAEDNDEKMGYYKASSYQDYQGDKLVKRFNAWSYYRISQLSDSHNVGRGRGGVRNALKSVKAKTLCIGIRSDILYPVDEQKYVAQNITGGSYAEIDSFYGHDGFLIETEQVTELIKNFLNDKR
ncbi:MAG TPA: homoserine O-acetyltransferase [Bacteroidales bacterium]|nr:homoserine O-acetyltransferase [Bacteroidales bacterium]